MQPDVCVFNSRGLCIYVKSFSRVYLRTRRLESERSFACHCAHMRVCNPERRDEARGRIVYLGFSACECGFEFVGVRTRCSVTAYVCVLQIGRGAFGILLGDCHSGCQRRRACVTEMGITGECARQKL